MKKNKKDSILYGIGILAILSIAGLLSCTDDDVVIQKKAQQRVNHATFAHQEVCGQALQIVVPVFHDVRNSDLLSCEGELLSGGCPMSPQIPPSCWLMLLKDAPENRDSDE